MHNCAMTATGDSKASYLSYSRWTMKRGADLDNVLTQLRDAVQPAYASMAGFLGLTFLSVVDSRDYLVVVTWDTRDDYDNWVRQNDEWRKTHAEAFENWQKVMDYDDEFQASILFQS